LKAPCLGNEDGIMAGEKSLGKADDAEAFTDEEK
jgi:hypothetical protein